MAVKMSNLLENNQEILLHPRAFAQETDACYDARLLRIAKAIYDHRAETPIILLSGPSGSGKTTSALMLEKLLDGWGCETHTLSMDNYFLPFTPQEHKLAAEGKMDLESPGRVDIELLNRQLTEMIRGETVALPRYEFKNSTREYNGTELTRRPGDLVILEGIHALNPAVITLPEESTARIYVSVRTRLTDGCTVLHPAKIRLLRRMARDKIYRDRSVRETLLLYPSVEAGEQKYILPHKYRATYEMDTFSAFEVNVYKSLLLNELNELHDKSGIEDLVALLNEAAPLPEADVPKCSMIREFIGNGQFTY